MAEIFTYIEYIYSKPTLITHIFSRILVMLNKNNATRLRAIYISAIT